MLHPSYSDLIKVANSEVEPGDAKVVNSRYSIVMAIAKRARQIIDGDEPLVYAAVDKPLSIAVEELNKGEIKILSEDTKAEEQMLCYWLVDQFGEHEQKRIDRSPLGTSFSYIIGKFSDWHGVKSNYTYF